MPEGWRVRRTAGGKNERLLSPQGEEVKSRRAAVQLLISTKAPTEKVFVCFYFHSYLIFDPPIIFGSPEKVAEMMTCLKHEGWESSEDLPKGWTFKKVNDCQVDD